jgi:hypothetical protein
LLDNCGYLNISGKWAGLGGMRPNKAHVLASWTQSNVQAFGVRWSNASGSVLIASLPGSGNGRLGIIRGHTFTPLNVPDDAAPWMDGVGSTKIVWPWRGL